MSEHYPPVINARSAKPKIANETKRVECRFRAGSARIGIKIHGGPTKRDKHTVQ